jgi:hypothetical protein
MQNLYYKLYYRKINKLIDNLLVLHKSRILAKVLCNNSIHFEPQILFLAKYEEFNDCKQLRTVEMG